MKYFKNQQGEVFAYESNGSQDEFIPEQLVEMTQEEVDLHLSSKLTAPQIVSKFQGRAALAQAGLLASVQSYMDAQPADSLAKLAWEHAQEFRRQSPSVLAIASALNLTNEKLDELFVLAATIEA
jgi:hypothetical protein